MQREKTHNDFEMHKKMQSLEFGIKKNFKKIKYCC